MTIELAGAAVGLGLLASILSYQSLMILGASQTAQLSLSEPSPENAATRLSEPLVKTLERLAPLDRRSTEELGEALALSGSAWTPSQLRASQVAGLFLGAALGMLPARGSVAVPFFIGAGALMGFTSPRLLVIVKRRSWHKELQRELPDMLDLLSVAVTSGSTLDDGLRIVAESMEGALAKACAQIVRRSQQEPVARGFERFATGTGLTDLVQVGHAVAHATESGAPMSKVLMEQAKRLRTLRKLQVDEASAKLDNQITVVCGLLVMPAAFAAALLPYVWSIVQQFGTF